MNEPRPEPLHSISIRGGRSVYFVDVRLTKNGKPYLAISEQGQNSDGQARKVTIRLFGDAVPNFKSAVIDCADRIRGNP
jgi:hypothetical protein